MLCGDQLFWVFRYSACCPPPSDILLYGLHTVKEDVGKLILLLVSHRLVSGQRVIVSAKGLVDRPHLGDLFLKLIALLTQILVNPLVGLFVHCSSVTGMRSGKRG